MFGGHKSYMDRITFSILQRLFQGRLDGFLCLKHHLQIQVVEWTLRLPREPLIETLLVKQVQAWQAATSLAWQHLREADGAMAGNSLGQHFIGHQAHDANQPGAGITIVTSG